MNQTLPSIEELILNIHEEIHVKAPLEATFAAVLDEIGPYNEADGKPMPMTIEAWPGGRWFRDLGNGDGHFWGHVQAIRRPTLLEITGPMFMSYPVAANIQYRLSEVDGGTLISFRHSALGLIQENHRKGVSAGWGRIHQRVKTRAEGNK